VVADITGGV